MAHADDGTPGRDLTGGVPLTELEEGVPLFGQVDGYPVLLIRTGDEVRAMGAKCTHYGGSLAQGLLHEGTVRCPLHHACFSLKDGTVRGGPAFNPLPLYAVEVRDGVAHVGEKRKRDPLAAERPTVSYPESMVIVGAGAAGSSAAETLRREGYDGEIVMIDPDPDAPYDRPNLSKDYLAGDAPEEWLPLRGSAFYREHGIRRLENRVTSIELADHHVVLDSGERLTYGALLLATGAAARTLDVPGADQAHVLTLRSLADCRAIIAAAEGARTAAVVGASFIGMEAAASLRQRGLEVTVVAPEEVPFARILGPDLGTFIRDRHEANGVAFRLGRTVGRLPSGGGVVLDDGSEVEGDLVVVGVGVLPDTTLAEAAGLDVDRGVVVDRYLRTSSPAVFAAGDIARYPDPRTGRQVRIEHWVVAGRQGRTAARNMLGREEPYTDVPFFWTRQFGRSVLYVGHAEAWDRIDRDGDCADGGCALRYVQGDRALAVATVGRSGESLRAEAHMERESRGRPPGSTA